MRGKEREEWMALCGMAADAEDLNQLSELTAEITLLLKLRAIRLSTRNQGTTKEWSEVQPRSSSIQ
jgi:hypothetical protein